MTETLSRHHFKVLDGIQRLFNQQGWSIHDLNQEFGIDLEEILTRRRSLTESDVEKAGGIGAIQKKLLALGVGNGSTRATNTQFCGEMPQIEEFKVKGKCVSESRSGLAWGVLVEGFSEMKWIPKNVCRFEKSYIVMSLGIAIEKGFAKI